MVGGVEAGFPFSFCGGSFLFESSGLVVVRTTVRGYSVRTDLPLQEKNPQFPVKVSGWWGGMGGRR
ncbi:hypothetical protein GLYMA_06G057800v4 [Glycine max]|uniref:Uncharacterized protein n=2 Tax=Glycine subgen. Soja TaxID=1462606 RepID=K7KTB5_SOYBN|nr:hypothetical protein JHK85_014854 [Glycine max]KAH1124355.1 hypothetical protein GYH30_014200 [Glycine max]KRH52274.1 hypothetical protein GLYMA_06G057800v4 [Glycine max]RZC05997.1 hypothetical protein D0Y65_013846 [Glycine soja]